MVRENSGQTDIKSGEKMMYIICILLAMVTPLLAQNSINMKEPEMLIKSPLSSFSIQCGATGSPKPTIKWYRNGDEVESGMMTKINRDGTLNIVMMERFIGKYQCKAENILGVSLSNITQVDMAFLKDFDSPPGVLSPISVQEGDPLKLGCRYSDPFSNPEPRWSWVLQDSLDPRDPRQKLIPLDGRISVDERGSLYFQHVLRTDNPNDWFFLCAAWNPVLNIKKTGSPIRIRINPQSSIPERPPVLVYQNGNNGFIEAVEGKHVSMYCIFKGYPKVHITWYKTSNGTGPITNYDGTYYNGNTRVVLHNVKRNNNYAETYECRGQQAGRSEPAVVGRFRISILQKPTFIQGPENINVTDGGTVTFKCITKSKPPAEIQWLVNGELINNLPYDPRRSVTGNQFQFERLRRGTSPSDSDLQVVTCLAITYRRDDGSEIGRAYKNGYINVFSKEPLSTEEPSTTVQTEPEITIEPLQLPKISLRTKCSEYTYTNKQIEVNVKGTKVSCTFILNPGNSEQEPIPECSTFTRPVPCVGLGDVTEVTLTNQGNQQYINTEWVKVDDGVNVYQGQIYRQSHTFTMEKN